ncbi:hypothetical protein [Methylotenera sp.]|uniref:hypothetical protein n=1 Tax=Methylotenera sp. TaxID=2051956 RepID=UPI0027314BB0|nr:hypothetical protein [Methylotenera sp.]MDP2231335.1 hypothetical protein [Methylotenera sp.]MDP3141950.1 hypothetical protein [Methylotenera sp.]
MGSIPARPTNTKAAARDGGRFHLYSMGHWWDIFRKQATTIAPASAAYSIVTFQIY